MFDTLNSQELIGFGSILIRANRTITATYGVDSDLNTELLAIWDELENLFNAHGINF